MFTEQPFRRLRQLPQQIGTVAFPLAVALVTLSVFVPDTLPIALLGLGILLALAPLAAKGPVLLRTPIDIPVALLSVLAVISLWTTPDLSRSAPQVLRLLSGIGLFYITVAWAQDRRRMAWILRLILVARLTLALLAPITVAWITDKVVLVPDWIYQIVPLGVDDPIHPNVMAGALAMIWPLSVGVFFFRVEPFLGAPDTSKYLRQGLILISCLIMGSALFISQSRGGWLGAGLSFGLLVLLRWQRARLLAV